MASQTWSHIIDGKDYIVSTSNDFLTLDFVRESFAHPDMWWATPMSEENMKTMLENCTTLGLGVKDAENNAVEPIGFARIVTDRVTCAYLSDVFIVREHRGNGLGKWLISCCGEYMDSLPVLRRVMLMASDAEGPVNFYQKLLGVEKFQQGTGGIVFMTKRVGATKHH
jgi:GNAT superfamily N-acetyltransferase